MGAIFGLYGQHDRDDARRMAERLRHRGRNVAIRSVADDLTLGAIGHDPEDMLCAAAGRTLVTDATVYNRQELFGDFGDARTSPEPPSVAELLDLLALVEEPDRLEAINGEFAIVFIDRHKGSIHFARDFFGCHPLYICALPEGGVAFASEYKALLALRGVIRTVDRDMVQYLQCAKKLPVGRTLLKEVLEVPPGQLTSWNKDDGLQQAHVTRPLNVDASVRDESQAIDLVRSLLRESLRARIDDLDTIGLALSGGIDSIALAFLLRDLRPDGVIHTFTSGSGSDDKELRTAAQVAKAIGSVHHEVLTPPAILQDRLAPFVWHIEDPHSRSEALQLFEIGRVAADFVSVLLTGQGADGLFAGMPKHRLLWLADRLPLFRNALEEFYNLTQIGARPTRLSGRLLGYLKYRGKLPDVPTVSGATLPGPTPFPRPGPEFINRTACRGLQNGACQDVHKIERAFSAFGIEYRLPFYDMRLVRAAFTITDRLKVTGRTRKYIFRKAMEGMVPGAYCRIPKFPQRMRYDLAFSEQIDQVGRELLLGKDGACDRNLYVESTLRGLFRSSSRVPYSDEAAMRIWTAATTELWFRMFVDRSMDGAAAASKPGTRAA